MPGYIVLMNYTDQGIRTVKQSPDRRKAAVDAAEKMGVKVKEAYMTLGMYDLVIVADAQNDEAITTWSLSLSSLGNVRSETMRAYSAIEMDKILAKIS